MAILGLTFFAAYEKLDSFNCHFDLMNWVSTIQVSSIFMTLLPLCNVSISLMPNYCLKIRFLSVLP